MEGETRTLNLGIHPSKHSTRRLGPKVWNPKSSMMNRELSKGLLLKELDPKAEESVLALCSFFRLWARITQLKPETGKKGRH